MRTTSSAGRKLGALVVVAVVILGALVGACASDGGGKKATPGAAWATALAIGARDARLAGVLRARSVGEGWEAEGDHFTSPGWRGVKDALRDTRRGEKRWSELGSRLPVRADGAFEVGVSQFPALRLRLTPRDAEGVKGELQGGHVVYAGAYGAGSDVVMSTTRDSVEELVLLRKPTVHASFAWEVELPSGIARGVLDADGSLRFEDGRGQYVMHVPAPYAVDARGTKRAARLTWHERDGTHVLGVELDADALAFPVLLDPAFEKSVWEKVQGPAELRGHAMAYDPARGRVILFGGSRFGSQRVNDTWSWDGTTWTLLVPAGAPPARERHAMAYDAARGRIVLFGGSKAVGQPELNDTWTWDGVTWTQATPAISPPARQGHALAYDAARGKVVLFGGDQFTADTWTWDGAAWAQASPATSPPARTGHGMAYDVIRGRVVLFGGSTVNGSVLANDTWTWDGTTWTKASPALSPSARFDHAMTYDATRGRVLLFGGGNAGLTPNDTWTWTGTTWALETAASSPPGRLEHALAFDAARGLVVLFGGGGGILDDTWTWNGSTWTQVSPFAMPPKRQYHGMADDAARGRVVMFGGYGGSGYLNDTWTWDGGKWTNATPSVSPLARNGHAMAYDAVRGRVVLFGGGTNPGPDLNDTWTWNGTSWTQAFPATSPPKREFHAMAYDAARARVVLFSGEGAATADTWTWDGTTWTQAFPATSPPQRNTHAMAYDAARGRVVLFGGERRDVVPGVLVNDTWTWDGTNWTNVSPASSPPPRNYHAMAYDGARGRVVLFGGYSQLGPLGDTWTWDGTTWLQVSPTVSPAPRANHAMAYDAARRRVVLFGNKDTSPPPDTWLYYSRAGSCSATTECGSGFCVDGVCCDVPSCGTCQACDGASSPGICTSVKSAPDPDSCPGAQACDATGACRPGPGAACTTGAQCASGFCTDGVCCDSACTGTCQACSAALKTSGADGACGSAKAGVDPHNDCGDDGAPSCQRDGQCDGAGRCRLFAQGTPCGAVTCDKNRASSQRCDGLGVCSSAAMGVDCTPYLCNAATGSCANPCASDAQCVLGNYCAAGTCKPRIDFGKPCTSAAGCPLGAFCADGVCCNTPCAGQCEVCDSPAALGSCIPFQGAPHAGRTACSPPEANNVCSAASCDGTERASCNGFVGPQIACRGASCTAGVATLSAKCSGKGQCQDLVTVTCTPYVCAGAACGTSCASDGECDANFRCDANHTCVPNAGASCDGDHTLEAPDRTKTDCAPYRCGGAACKTTCASVVDCAQPNVCINAVCLPVPGGETPTQGCGCRIGQGTDGRYGATGLMLISIALIARRRRRTAASL